MEIDNNKPFLRRENKVSVAQLYTESTINLCIVSKKQNFFFMSYLMYGFGHHIDPHAIILLACVAPNSCVAEGPHYSIHYSMLMSHPGYFDDIISHLRWGIL